jgi:RimJ/RimL family protein N-acetyltransferase
MKVYLRAFESQDLDLLHKWHNDDEINMVTGGRKFFISKERERKWLEDKMLNDRDQLYCAICIAESLKMIGFTSLNEIDYVSRKAVWGGIAIGDSTERGKGYAKSASILLFNHGFNELNLNKIYGRWLASNEGSIILGKKLGFKQDGILREELFKGNKFHDIIVMSLLKSEFVEKIF